MFHKNVKANEITVIMPDHADLPEKQRSIA